MSKSKTNYIFVSGGVISGIGKGITAASISLLLKSRGYTVTPIKCENYLNVDSGTINPIEHGDPYLCNDGLEADQDLGNYERYLQQEVGRANFMTMGQLYQTVIRNERDMVYEGEDVEPIPHVVNEIIRRIKDSSKDSDFAVIELGGTVGEYENNNGLYYEAARLMAIEEKVAHVHVTYVLTPPHLGEPKTKPAQFGIRDLMSMGVTPDFLVVRAEEAIDSQRRYKFAFKFGIQKEHIISAENLEDIHDVPLHLHAQRMDERILEFFGVKNKKAINLKEWQNYVGIVHRPKANKAKIAIVGKYFGTGNSQLNDSYHALLHAIEFAATNTDTNVQYILINSDKDEDRVEDFLKDADGIIVPIGWGTRGVEGKIKAIKYARENKIPYLGLCYGMQLAAVEFARNVLKLKDAHAEEVKPDAKHKIIHSIPFDEKYQTIKGNGVSMRLGAYDCILKKNSLAAEIYKTDKSHVKDVKKNGDVIISERHRHRYEFNNDYRKQFEKAGFAFSGVSPDDFYVEMIELPKDVHPFFVATQAHPEYKAYPLHPHPLFVEFIKASLK